MPTERRVGLVDLAHRVEHVEQQLATVISNQQNVMSQLAETSDTLHDVIVEIGGAPDEIGRDNNRPSVRGRIHKLESDRSAAQAATAAVAASKTIYDAATDRRFSRLEKVLGLAFAFIVAAGPYIALIIHSN